MIPTRKRPRACSRRFRPLEGRVGAMSQATAALIIHFLTPIGFDFGGGAELVSRRYEPFRPTLGRLRLLPVSLIAGTHDHNASLALFQCTEQRLPSLDPRLDFL